MTRWACFCCIWIWPALFAGDVVNAADHSGGGVTPGEVVIIYPSDLGPAVMVPWGLAGNLTKPFVTGDTRVLFDSIPAIVMYSVRGQVGAIVPYQVAGNQTTTVVVEYQGKPSLPLTLPVIERAPAVFTLDATGKGQAAMLNDTGCCNSVRNPAVRGTAASLYATGEGRITRGRIAPEISVTVGGVPAKIQYTGMVGCLQVNFLVPQSAPVGEAVPLVLMVGNRRSSPDVTMAVRSARQRVLVLDDDVATRQRLTRILSSAGYDVSSEDHSPDLVILDLATPPEVLNTLKKARPQLRIIAMSPALDSAALREADLLGAQAVITKPINPSKVLSTAHTFLRRRTAVY